MSDPYDAIQFGQVQNVLQASQERPQLFKGISIYVNGYAPQSELRRHILEHGGDYQQHLKKSSVTHILATTLTNAKIESLRNYKVVDPSWVTDSIAAGRLLPWTHYRLGFSKGPEDQSTMEQNEPVKETEQGEKRKREEEERETVIESVSPVQINTIISQKDKNNKSLDEDHDTHPDIIKNYYKNSRLHHLSAWKEELKDKVRRWNLENAGFKGRNKKGKRPENHRVVMHIDFDAFFASVSLLDRPHLKDRPVAVAHSKGAKDDSSSEIASCNYIARQFGIHNGMMMSTAKIKCPELQSVPYEFEKYKAVSDTFYQIIFEYADEIQAVSVDEALLEVASHVTQPGTGQEMDLATQIRDKIRSKTGCNTSVGVGPNILIARLANRRAKPNGQYICGLDQIQDLLSSIEVTDLPGVGRAMKSKLYEMGVRIVKDLALVPLSNLQANFGTKIGQTLHNFSKGIDDRLLSTHPTRQSVSAEVNWGIRFENEEKAKTFIDDLAKEVSERLDSQQMKGRSITLKIMRRKLGSGAPLKYLGYGDCDTFSRSTVLPRATDDNQVIAKNAWNLYKQLNFTPSDVRGVGIQIQKLEAASVSDKTQFFGAVPLNTEPVASRSLGKTKNDENTTVYKRKMVDRDVFIQLPESTRLEISDAYKVVFMEKEGTSSAVNTPTWSENRPECIGGSSTAAMGHSETSELYVSPVPDNDILDQPSFSDLPPWSQLDPTMLLALSTEMQQQILKQYGQIHEHHDKKLKINHRDFETENKFQKESRNRTTAGGTTKNTLTQMFSRNYYEDEDAPLDMSAVNELPADIREEILENERRKKNRQKNTSRSDVKKKHTPADVETRPSFCEPKLMGLTDIRDIRVLLKTWERTPENIRLLTEFVMKLAHNKDLDKARLVVLSLDQVSNVAAQGTDPQSWRAEVEELRLALKEHVFNHYRCNLRF
ncbi:hypothetical protein J3Q64DRAFT_1733812 [Phycomyces blakesleeanus]|uniref:DNA repair protein REV1 n=1 Tax=Phycomyces blakesleeanus TaxID=4837 RepID=A0ABR3B335_PHYBL